MPPAPAEFADHLSLQVHCWTHAVSAITRPQLSAPVRVSLSIPHPASGAARCSLATVCSWVRMHRFGYYNMQSSRLRSRPEHAKQRRTVAVPVSSSSLSEWTNRCDGGPSPGSRGVNVRGVRALAGTGGRARLSGGTIAAAGDRVAATPGLSAPACAGQATGQLHFCA